jgi:hypothetical protein
MFYIGTSTGSAEGNHIKVSTKELEDRRDTLGFSVST